VTLTTKHCRKCNQTKPVAEFSRARRERDGLQDKCRQCAAAYMEMYRSTHADHIKALNAVNNARRGEPKTLTLAQAMHNMVRAGR
jgi:hypothetical protein